MVLLRVDAQVPLHFVLLLPTWHLPLLVLLFALVFLLSIELLLRRGGEFALEAAALLLLVVEDPLELEDLVLEFPECEFGVIAVGLDFCNFLAEAGASLSGEAGTSDSSPNSLPKRASRICIFSRSMRNCLELRTSSSEMTISWCSPFSLPLKRFSWAYLRPRLFMSLQRRAVYCSSLKGAVLSERVFSEMECLRSSPMCLRLDFSGSFITNFIIYAHKYT